MIQYLKATVSQLGKILKSHTNILTNFPHTRYQQSQDGNNNHSEPPLYDDDDEYEDDGAVSAPADRAFIPLIANRRLVSGGDYNLEKKRYIASKVGCYSLKCVVYIVITGQRSIAAKSGHFKVVR